MLTGAILTYREIIKRGGGRRLHYAPIEGWTAQLKTLSVIQCWAVVGNLLGLDPERFPIWQRFKDVTNDLFVHLIDKKYNEDQQIDWDVDEDLKTVKRIILRLINITDNIDNAKVQEAITIVAKENNQLMKLQLTGYPLPPVGMASLINIESLTMTTKLPEELTGDPKVIQIKETLLSNLEVPKFSENSPIETETETAVRLFNEHLQKTNNLPHNGGSHSKSYKRQGPCMYTEVLNHKTYGGPSEKKHDDPEVTQSGNECVRDIFIRDGLPPIQSNLGTINHLNQIISAQNKRQILLAQLLFDNLKEDFDTTEDQLTKAEHEHQTSIIKELSDTLNEAIEAANRFDDLNRRRLE